MTRCIFYSLFQSRIFLGILEFIKKLKIEFWTGRDTYTFRDELVLIYFTSKYEIEKVCFHLKE